MANDLTTSGGTAPATTSVSTGATITSIYVERSMKTYAIPEHELDSLGLLNGQFAFWSSLGTGFVFLVLSCIWDFSKESIPDNSKKLAYLFAGIAVVCYIVAGVHFLMKRSRIGAIKRSAGGGVEDEVNARSVLGTLESARPMVLLGSFLMFMLAAASASAGIQASDIHSVPIVAVASLAGGAMAWLWWHLRPRNFGPPN